LLLAALHRSREVQQGQDEETKLYYALTVNDDGSGRQDLFVDAAHSQPAGSFTWPAPQWRNGQPDTYPAILQVTYSITAGEFAGTHGTMDITLNDATGTNGLIHLVLDDSHKEHCEADFKIVSDVVSATQRVNLADGFSYREED